MTGLTDVRDRTLTMLRALGIEPDPKQMRTVEKYVRWVDGQISTAHIDGRALEREVVGGHEIVVTHQRWPGDVEWVAHCHEREGAPCRLTCGEGCEEWGGIKSDADGAFHAVETLGDPIQHRMVDSGECQAVVWLNEDDAGLEELGAETQPDFEIGRFRIKPVWTGEGFEWERLP